MLRSSRRVADKSMFAAKRRVILPIHANPLAASSIIRGGFTTDPLKITTKPKFATSSEGSRAASDEVLEGERSRRALELKGDGEFQALVAFIEGANYDQMISGRRFRDAYHALTEHDDVFVWLCHVAMSVLNPGDVRSRLVYRHLEALVQAVTSGEMTRRTAFRFYESAIRAPAFRQAASRQLEAGTATRIAGICAAAEAMRRSGACRRPMSSYFELFQRITERSEANTPWGFPPLLQFEEKLQLPDRLRFFSRDNQRTLQGRRRRNMLTAPLVRLQGPRRFWLPPTWTQTHHKFMYPGFSSHKKQMLE